MNREQITELIFSVLSEYDIRKQQEEWQLEIPVEASARHVHLTEEAIHILFGEGASLTVDRPLSQPGQFLSKERVTLVTQKGKIDQVAVLGPTRPAVQVELSNTDCRQLGIQAPVRLSGDLTGAASVYLVGPKGMMEARESAIVAQAHIHFPPEEAKRAGIQDKEEVSVTIESERKITLERVICRISSQSGLAMHIDLDEANACLLPKNGIGKIKIKERSKKSRQNSRKESQKEPPKEVLVTEGSLPYLVGGRLVTEAAARQLAADAGKELRISDEIILTPSAKDVLRHAGVNVLRQGGKFV